MKLKYVFMGTPQIAATILDLLHKAGCDPVAVVTQPARSAGRGRKVKSSEVHSHAMHLGLPALATSNVNAPESLEFLKTHDPDLILVVAFGQLLKEPVLTLPRLGCLNIHASLLPQYRGAAPVQRAIWNGDKETGVTIQKMVKALDAGDVLLQRKTPIEAQETSGQLLERLAILGADAANEALKRAETGDLRFTPQDPSQVTLAPKIQREEATLCWQKSAHFLHNQIRALQPWPIAETYLSSQRLKVFRSEPLPSAAGEPGEPGSVLTDNKQYLHVVCGDGGVLALTEIQLENRKRLNVEDFLRGYQVPITHMGKPSEKE